MIILWSIFVIMLAILSMIGVVYSFVGDTKIFYFIFKRAFDLAFKKKEQDRYIESTTKFLNNYFQTVAEQIVSSKDIKLEEMLDISGKDVKQFKIIMNDILKNKDKSFFSSKGVRLASKRNKDFNFLKLIVDNTRLFANDKAILMKKLSDEHEENIIDDKDYYSRLMGLNNLTAKQARAKLLLDHQKVQHEKEVLPFATKIVNKTDMKSLYDMSLNQQLV